MTESKIDILLMSPPCQPFTRQGKKLDDNDKRTKSFFYLLNEILPKLLPKSIIIENVKNFEDSRTREKLIEFLEKYGYQFEEFLLSPLDLGVPYQRSRYFLVASMEKKEFKNLKESLGNFPVLGANNLVNDDAKKQIFT